MKNGVSMPQIIMLGRANAKTQNVCCSFQHSQFGEKLRVLSPVSLSSSMQFKSENDFLSISGYRI